VQNEGKPNERRVTIETRYQEKWKWYPIIYELANGDILNMDKVTELKLYQALTFLSYKQDKFILEKKQSNPNQIA